MDRERTQERYRPRRISYIIPAHNAGTTLERAVTSIAKSEDAEILIIENGSTDQTWELIERLARDDSRICPLRSEKGVSRARNIGLDHASGEWIVFLDVDDCLTDDAEEILSRYTAEGGSDLYLFGHYAGTEERKVTSTEKGRTVYRDTECSRGIIEMLGNPTRYMQAWAKLFRASIIRDNDLRFDESLTLAEDSDFTLRYALHARSICLCEETIYQYSLSPQSVMRRGGNDKVHAYELAMERTSEALQGKEAEILHAYAVYCLMHFNIAMVREVFAHGSTGKTGSKIRRMRETIAKPVFQKALQSVKLQECGSLRMLPILCLKLGLMLPAALIYRIRAGMNYRNETKANA